MQLAIPQFRWSLVAALLLAIPRVVTAQTHLSRARDTTVAGVTIRPATDETAFALDVELTIPRTRDSVTVFDLPDEWAGRTALYRNIVELHATSAGATLLAGSDSAHVRVRAPVGKPLTLRYKLRETLPSTSAPDAHNHSEINRNWAQLVGYDALVLPAVDASTPMRVTFGFSGLPQRSVIATSFGVPRAGDSLVVAHGSRGEIQEAAYTFAIAPGKVRMYPRAVPGGKLNILVRGNFAIADSQLVSAVQRVVSAQRKFWGGKAPSHYLVSIGVASRGTLAGVRLTNAFVADMDSTRALDDNVFALFSHELMHDWIGGAIHPQADVKDGALAWFTEGFTDYMAHRVMWQSGLLTDSAYIEIINGVLANHALSLARDSSWSAIVNGFWRDVAMQREPYLRGELLALRLDREARTMTPTKGSVQQSLKLLLASEAKHGTGVTDSSLRAHFNRTLGPFSNGEITRALNGGELILNSDSFRNCAVAHIETRTPWDPGFNVDSSLKSHAVVGTRVNGPAAAAGLRDSMIITRTSIWFGNSSKPLVLGVRTAAGDTVIQFIPAGKATVNVQSFAPTRARCTLRE